MPKRTNKLSIPVIMAPTGDQALATGTLASATTALGVASMQLGVLSWDYAGTKPLGTFIAATDDASEVSAIKIICGTPASPNTQLADVWENGDKAYLESGVIRRDKIRSVATRKGRYPMWGGFAGTNFSAPTNNVEYKAVTRLLSVRADKEFGGNDNIITTVVPAKDYTALGTVSPKDFSLKYIVNDINMQSRLLRGNKNVIAFAVKIAGGVGTVIGTAVKGTSIPFATVNGTTYSVTADEALLRSLAHLVNANAALVGTSTILNVNMTTAGAAADADAIIVLGLPEQTAAYYDNIEQVQTSAEVTFGGGFQTTDALKPTVSKMWSDEGTGQGSKWKLLSNDRYLLTVGTMQNHPFGEWFSAGKDYINEATLYSSFSIDYFDSENALNTEIHSPKNVTILLPCEKDSTFVLNVNNIVTRLAAGNTPVLMLTSNGAGTGTASVNTVPGITAILTQWLEYARVNYSNFDLIGEAVVGGPYLS